MKQLRRNEQGTEQVFRPFVLILSFVAITGMLLVLFSPYFIVGTTLDEAVDLSSLGIWDLSMFDPSTGYDVNNSTVVHEWPRGETGGLTFGLPGDETDKRVYVVRDSEDYDASSEKTWKKYPDYIGIKRKQGDDRTGKVFRYAIPLQRFVDVFDPKTNLSVVDFVMSKTNYSVVLWLCDNNTARIGWNNYTLYLGKSIFQESKAGLWNAIAMIMTGQIPNCNKYLNLMIAIVVNFTWVFVLYVMISRVIPFLPGS